MNLPNACIGCRLPEPAISNPIRFIRGDIELIVYGFCGLDYLKWSGESVSRRLPIRLRSPRGFVVGASPTMSARHHQSHFDLNKQIAEEWASELRRRIHRAALLLDHGQPDAGFDLLATEIHRFREMVRHAKKK
jgi:hypothetical protein